MLNALETAVYTTVHAAGGSKAVAPLLGIRPGVLSNKVNPDQVRNQLTLQEALSLQQVTGDHRILKAMAWALGYVLAPIQNFPASDVELLTLYARWQSADGQIHHCIAAALEDEQITLQEQGVIEHRFQEATTAGLTYLHRMRGLAQ